LAELARLAQQPQAREAIPKSFACDLCNVHWRLSRAVKRLAAEGQTPAEAASLQRSLDEMQTLLRERSIEYRDPTGERFSDPLEVLRLDYFEQICAAEEREGLEETTIVRVECPAVFIDGVLVERARGLIGKPPVSP
jgi:hypothetical protein